MSEQCLGMDDGEVAGFVCKTYEMLGVEEFQKIVYWSTNGLEFVIKDIVKFEEIVLPRYFRHKKINSFVRQLNMYGFHKMKHNHFKSTFKHPCFQKGHPELLTLIRRKPKSNDKDIEDTPEERPIQNRPYLPLSKQEEPTMPNEKWANLSQEFLQTTKMINMSLVKVSCNELSQIVGLGLLEEEDDCVSIECELGWPRNEPGLCQFEDPACFFASRFQL